MASSSPPVSRYRNSERASQGTIMLRLNGEETRSEGHKIQLNIVAALNYLTEVSSLLGMTQQASNHLAKNPLAKAK